MLWPEPCIYGCNNPAAANYGAVQDDAAGTGRLSKFHKISHPTTTDDVPDCDLQSSRSFRTRIVYGMSPSTILME